MAKAKEELNALIYAYLPPKYTEIIVCYGKIQGYKATFGFHSCENDQNRTVYSHRKVLIAKIE